MLAVAGETVMDVSALAVTVSVAVPLTLPAEAVMVVEPLATPVAIPAALMVAAAVELVQVAVKVRFPVDPSLYVAVAVNCCEAPAGMLAVAGVTARAVIALAVTVNCALPVTPLNEAVTVVVPGANPVARPVALIVATEAAELVHATDVLTSAVVPLL